MKTTAALIPLVLVLSSACGVSSPPTCETLVCGANASCVDPGDGASCVCDTGFTGDGEICMDVDECATDPCDVNATCANSEGSFACTCNQGYEGQGVTCTDIDECADGTDACDANATCTNIPASYTCACNAGFDGDGETCTDIDECADGVANCDVNATCANIPGSWTCTCNEGYDGDGVTCADIDECLADPCDVNATCDNTEGSFICTCDEGWEGDGLTCSDVDECTLGTDTCDVNATCTNIDGAFTCACNMGYIGDGFTCTSLSPCTTVEDFEGGVWPATGWTAFATGGSVTAAAAHDGSFGVADPGWHYKTATTVGAVGDVLSAWARSSGATTGRFYFGFNAGAAGAKSLIMAPNTSSLLFQNNVGYGFADVVSVPQTYTAATWYKLEITFGAAGLVTGRLYASDGLTLLNTVSTTFTGTLTGGVAIRGFGPTVSIDTIQNCVP